MIGTVNQRVLGAIYIEQARDNTEEGMNRALPYLADEVELLFEHHAIEPEPENQEAAIGDELMQAVLLLRVLARRRRDEEEEFTRNTRPLENNPREVMRHEARKDAPFSPSRAVEEGIYQQDVEHALPPINLEGGLDLDHALEQLHRLAAILEPPVRVSQSRQEVVELEEERVQ